MKRSAILGIVLLFIAITSCDKGIVFQQVSDFPNGRWGFQDIKRFEANISDTLNPHLLLVDLRNTTAYEYSNMWLFITQINPDGTSQTDTVDCPLALPSGKWLGKSASDGLDNLVLFRKDYIFPSPGVYTYKVQHGMRSDTLSDVRSVGIRIQKGY
jgi:gliding motility-associated lipoprotein GldH